MSDMAYLITITAIFGGLVILLWRVGLAKERRREYERAKRRK